VVKIAYQIDIEKLRPLGEMWFREHRARKYNIDISVDDILRDGKHWMEIEEAAVIVALDGDEPVGFLALFATDSFLGKQKLAVEKYWFATKGIAIRMLINEAKKWAKEHGCSHLLMVASHIAGDKYRKVIDLYHHLGMKLFETTFICEV
jgi:GNAT superfamily N-acetyltransferase